MIRSSTGESLYSATDLLAFLGCTHATALDLAVVGGGIGAPPKIDDPDLALLARKGDEHERLHLERLRAAGRTVCEIATDDTLDGRAEATRQAMRDGVEVIYQGTLVNRPWHGYSDFLIRVATPSALGDWSYEVHDTKLARTARPKHVLQLCLYSQMVALVQERLPAEACVVLGNGREHRVRVNDYLHYCETARERFEAFVRNGDGGGLPTAVPEPCIHCGNCRWADRCDAQREESDHLSRVARLSGVQARKLRSAGLMTMAQLAATDEALVVPKLQPATFTRVRAQARLQDLKRRTGDNQVETLPLDARRGFARMPPADEGDLFFDMEGYPLYSADGSLEYLFGFHYREHDEPRYQAFWARTRDEERKAFEDALDFITVRLERFPKAFVYHYAAYEQIALRRLAQQYGTSKRQQPEELKRLAQAYGTRENEVDDLLRGRKLVDLYKVVRESIQCSEPSYSLKNLETFYGLERTEEISSGGGSIVAFDRWMVEGDDTVLGKIEEYNRVDCESTERCRDWLLGLRPPEVTWFDPAAEQLVEDAEEEAKRRVADRHILDLREQLLAHVPEPERRWRELLGFLLEYHRREARRDWWDFFRRLESTVEELVDDVECIGGLILDRSVPPRAEKQSLLHTFRIPEQDFKLARGYARVDTRKGTTVFSVEGDRLELKVGSRQPPLPDMVSLIPAGPLNDMPHRAAIQRYAQAVIEGREAEYPAITSILRRERPRLDGGVILTDLEGDVLTGTIDAVERMRDTHLVIQGPPGSGKTYTAARAIVALLRAGRRVGVMAMAHKAIDNLLLEVANAADAAGVPFRGAKKFSEATDRIGHPAFADVNKAKDIKAGDYQLVGGTVWLFADPDFDRHFDYLFIDEAGQEALARVVAAGTSARNIVLVGDQMQLSQPVKGSHPAGSGVSALDYLMDGHATVPPDRGILLARTWRMHPDLCGFVSSAFYDDRLLPHPSTAGQRLVTDRVGDLLPTGLRFIDVDHSENVQRSDEEADRLAAAYDVLLGTDWVDQHGTTRRLTAADILVVSPYNMQVNRLLEVLPLGARVGTVDRFQGQEAAVVLLSMATSDGNSAPRGLEFLYSRNRLNVAVSRGRCAAVILASPALAAATCRTIEQLALVNTICWAQRWDGRQP